MTAKANPVSVSYFENLPRYLLPALRAAWDKVKTGQFGSKAIYAGFRRDCGEVGHEAPAVPVMNQWILGVLNGAIQRPGAPEVKKVEPNAESESGAFTPIVAADLPPRANEVAAIDMQAFSFDDLYHRLVEEKVDELTKGVRDEARRIVAEQLRQRLAELA